MTTLRRLVERLWHVDSRLNRQTAWGAATTALLEERQNIVKQINGINAHYARRTRNAKHGRQKE